MNLNTKYYNYNIIQNMSFNDDDFIFLEEDEQSNFVTSSENIIIPSHKRILIQTNIKLDDSQNNIHIEISLIPELILNCLDIKGKIIKNDEFIKLILYNDSDIDFTINIGDKLATLTYLTVYNYIPDDDIPLYTDVFTSLTKGSHKRVKIECHLCEKVYNRVFKDIIKNQERNNGNFTCFTCSRSKFNGRGNPNCKYKTLDDNFFQKINTEQKAYVLGWIASDGHIGMNNTISIGIHEKDYECLEQIRNIICSELPIAKAKNRDIIFLNINSKTICNDVIRHLKLEFNTESHKKSHTVQFPTLDTEELNFSFIRGYFDGDGCIYVSKKNLPRASIASCSENMLKSIENIIKIPSSTCKGKNGCFTLEYGGINAVDFLFKIYNTKISLYLQRKYEKFINVRDWLPYKTGRNTIPCFKYVKTCREAIPPRKNKSSDSGYDLHIIKKLKEENGVLFYDTGIKIQPDYGFYFEMVGRSSISKTGYMLANNIGIIDASYTGNIIVALIKTRIDSPELVLPLKLVQLIPRKFIILDIEEVESLDETERKDTGGLGSKQFFENKELSTGVSKNPNLLYKIMTTGEYTEFKSKGTFYGNEPDIKNGYINLFRSSEQYIREMNEYYSGEKDIYVVYLDYTKLQSIIFEKSHSSDEMYYHCYGTLNFGCVINAVIR
jgi:dUTP pyrophosphatase